MTVQAWGSKVSEAKVPKADDRPHPTMHVSYVEIEVISAAIVHTGDLGSMLLRFPMPTVTGVPRLGHGTMLNGKRNLSGIGKPKQTMGRSSSKTRKNAVPILQPPTS